jgi:5-methylcytosine-specific restriction endonuclease McrA
MKKINGKSVRDYGREVKEYTSRPEVVAKRVKQNQARAQAMKEGLVKKGDGKEVDHKKPLSKGGTNARSNLRVTSAKSNRSFARNADSSVKSQTSKRERKK